MEDLIHAFKGLQTLLVVKVLCGAAKLLRQDLLVDVGVEPGELLVEDDALPHRFGQERLDDVVGEVEERGGVDHVDGTEPKGKTLLRMKCMICFSI